MRETHHLARKGPVIHKLAGNTKGRDFIIGDIHGHRQTLEQLLSTSKFDYAKDRLFSVGDLVDRGPDSLGCLELIGESWFYPVLGNHDLNCLLFILNKEQNDRIIENLPGVGQGTRIPNKEAERQEYFPWNVHKMTALYGDWIYNILGSPSWGKLVAQKTNLLNLPHIIAVGDNDSRFHVVHAGLHPENIIEITNAANDTWVDNNMWAKSNPYYGTLQLLLARYNMTNNVEKMRRHLSPTYCGHTSVPQVKRFAQHINIDTGCSKGGKLSMICHQTQESFQI